MDDTVEMRRFGALNRFLKVTWITFGVGWLAILGVPPFSGFYSKDRIIEAAFVPVPGREWQAWTLGSVALLGAGITAFYMSRLFFMTFHGKRRWDDGSGDVDGPVRHPHEAPLFMTFPMVVLAIGSAGLGFLLAQGDRFVTWLEPVTGSPGHEEPVLSVPVLVTATLVLVAVGGLLAWRQYAASVVPVVPPVGTPVTRAARVDLYQDEVNDVALVQPGQYLTRSLVYGDSQVVDRGVGSLAHLGVAMGRLARRWQSGYVRSYAASILLGVVVVAVAVLATRI